LQPVAFVARVNASKLAKLPLAASGAAADDEDLLTFPFALSDTTSGRPRGFPPVGCQTSALRANRSLIGVRTDFWHPTPHGRHQWHRHDRPVIARHEIEIHAP
jgi:hypothetical protein